MLKDDTAPFDVIFFDVVARSTSLTQVGRELGVSVSSVSKRLARLESRLGVRLVHRSTRRLTLTPEGERYAEGAAAISAEMAELEESISGHYAELRGKLQIHSSVGLGRAHIAPLMAEFIADNPRVEVDVELSANLPACPRRRSTSKYVSEHCRTHGRLRSVCLAIGGWWWPPRATWTSMGLLPRSRTCANTSASSFVRTRATLRCGVSRLLTARERYGSRGA